MARLENVTYDEIVARLEREDSDDLPMVTSKTSTPNKNLLSNGLTAGGVDCKYCKKLLHMVKDCQNIENKREKIAQRGRNQPKKT